MISEKEIKKYVRELALNNWCMCELLGFHEIKICKLTSNGKTVKAYSECGKLLAQSICHDDDSYSLYKGVRICIARLIKLWLLEDLNDLRETAKFCDNNIKRIQLKIEKLNNTFKLNRKSREGDDSTSGSNLTIINGGDDQI